MVKKKGIIDRYRTRVTEKRMIKKEKRKEKKETPSRLAAGDKTKKNGQGKEPEKKEKKQEPQKEKQGQLKSILEVDQKPQEVRLCFLPRGGGPDRRPGLLVSLAPRRRQDV